LIKKIFFLILLIIAVAIVFMDIAWLYHNFEADMGTRMAQTAISYHVLLLLGMIAAGIGLGRWVDLLIREKRPIFQSPRKGSWAEMLMRLWGYELKYEAAETSPPNDLISESDPDMNEPLELLDLPTRRGRKPTFTLERWLPIAAKWENRDPIRDAFTLGELISEHLGTNSDGSPIVSEQTYYSIWRPRAIAELRRLAECRKSASMRELEKEQA
jgi:hypothetical protein